MEKFFNTAGLCNPEKHYMVNPLKRLNKIEDLIKKELYFTLHAPRQTGKTTFIHALARKLNRGDDYIGMVVSFESAGYRSITVERANEVLTESIYLASLSQLEEPYRPPKPEKGVTLKSYISDWCCSLEKPIVLLIDEIDALFDDTLINILRQLRDGYQYRPSAFPISIALVGLRDVREYRARLRPDSDSLGTASPFNIKAESIMMSNFTKEETFELLDQHGSQTGQEFSREIKEELFILSNGQPWLVNALANQIVNKILKEDYSKPITMREAKKARHQLIERRDTHLDSLADKLREERVKNVVQAILNGGQINFDIYDDDVAYTRDLGLITTADPLEFSNQIYAEIITRIMSGPIRASIPKEIAPPWFVTPEGRLDMEKLLKAFQKFYRRNSEIWKERFAYKESAHHLLLMAFLERVVNSGGEITREMALGNHRIDLHIKYGKEYPKQEFALELKVNKNSYDLEDAREQLTGYLDKLGLDLGYLVLFETKDLSWDEKIFYKEEEFQGKKLILVGV